MYWLENKVIHNHYQDMATGFTHEHWVNMIALDYIVASPVVASLGCGRGALERHICQINPKVKVFAVDLDGQKIDDAVSNLRDKSYETQVDYVVSDFDSFLEARNDVFDIVIYNMSLHHSQDPFRSLINARKSLKHDGLLVLNEYCGPSRLQVSERTKMFVESALRNYFRRYNLVDNFKNYVFPSISAVVHADVSESANTEILLPTVRELFVPKYFADISTGFLPACSEFFATIPDDHARLLCSLDSLLMDTNTLPSEYFFGVFSKK